MQSEMLSTLDNELENIDVFFINNTQEILVQTPNNVEVEEVYLINMLGQTVKSWNTKNLSSSNEIRIPVKQILEGNYIVKVLTTTGVSTKKVTIKI